MSASLTVGEIARRVKRQFGDESQAQIPDDAIIDWINDCQRELALSNHLLQQIARSQTVLGVSKYNLPPDTLEVISLKVEGRLLKALTVQEVNHFERESDGFPKAFLLFDDKITLYPTPSTSGLTMAIYYSRQPNKITTLQETPELPSMFHNQLVMYCIAQAYELDDNPSGYQTKMNMFNTGNDELRDRADGKTQEAYPYISVSDRDAGAGYDWWC